MPPFSLLEVCTIFSPFSNLHNIFYTTSESAGILTSALRYYLAASKALSEDNPHAAAAALEKFRDQIAQIVTVNSLAGKTSGIAAEINRLRSDLKQIDHNTDSLRIQFAALSNNLKNIFEKYEYKEKQILYLVFCPMAFNNKGGSWLQDSKEVKNPYFGPKMLKCGEIKKEYGRKIMETKPVTGHEGH